MGCAAVSGLSDAPMVDGHSIFMEYWEKSCIYLWHSLSFIHYWVTQHDGGEYLALQAMQERALSALFLTLVGLTKGVLTNLLHSKQDCRISYTLL